MTETQLCKKCQDPLVDDGQVRKKKRPRTCGKCKAAQRISDRHADPIKTLFHRWQTSAHKRWPSIDRALLTMDAVRRVWEQCEQKSVISGETNVKHLCISCYGIVSPMVPASIETDLVIVTSLEAQRISKAKSAEVQKAMFPREFSARRTNTNGANALGDDNEPDELMEIKRFKLADEDD